MTAPNEISEIVVQFRARLAANRHLAALLSRSVRDCRVKRILALLEEIAPHGEVIPPSAQEILKICDDDPVRYRGFHPRLAFLKENLSKATDFLAELSKRMLLYLKHIEVQGSSLSPSIRRLAQSAITEQKEMAVKLCQSACGAINIALSKPPGPAPMPYDDHRSEPTALSKSSRRLRGGKPSSIGHDYDSRWDPDYKMPGSQHGKFLTFAGPFFASHKDEAGNFDHFCLSANHGAHIESWKFKYEVVTTNFTDTGRLRTRNDEDMDRLRARQKDLGIMLSKDSGEVYDPDSIVFYDLRRPQNLAATTGPYLSSTWQIRKSRLGTGVWAFEDMNRILEVHQRGHRICIWPVEVGRVVVFDRRMSRSAKD